MRRLAALLGPSVVLLAAAGWLAAQDGPKKAPPREEEDETVKVVKPRRPLRDDDAAVTPKPARPQPAAPDAAIDLKAEAAAAAHPAVKELYRGLAVPHDDVHEIPADNVVTRAAPLPRYLGELLPPFREDLSFRPLSDDGRPGPMSKIESRKIRFVRHYEQIVLADCDTFLKRKLEGEPSGTPAHMSRYDQLAAVEKAYAFAARWHAAAVERGDRAGDGWRDVGNRLQAALMDAQLGQLAALAAANDPRADDVAARLAVTFPDSPQVQKAVLTHQIKRAEATLRGDDEAKFVDVRRNLEALERVYGEDKDGLKAVKKLLQEKAESYLREAEKLIAENRQAEALARLEAAERIDPGHARLRSERMRLTGAYPILYVGVDRLPELMSPATARTDAERMAVDLVFESLVEAVPDAAVGTRYRPGLAERLPAVQPLAREVTLPAGAAWSDGTPVLAGDVLDTLRLAGGPAAAAFDLDSIQVRDGRRLRLPLKRGLFDPLAALRFKVLPGQKMVTEGQKADDMDFARGPTGSGPYTYQGRDAAGGREQAVFRANPAYGNRPGREGQPRVREVRMVVAPDDPADALRAGKLHVLAGVPTDRLVKLLSPDAGLGQQIVTASPPHRRVHVLMVNHRTAALQDVRVRRAVQALVDREAILNAVFRSGRTDFHKELVGPYPASSAWAVPGGAKSLHDPSLARGLLGAAKVSPANTRTLKLLCPDDEASRSACEAIARQAEGLNVGLTLSVETLPPEALHKQVTTINDFELAYSAFDYPDGQLSLEGLLGPGNPLGYESQSAAGKLARLAAHRDFAEVRRLTHELHQLCVDDVPFVPLWQLDRHVVVRSDVRTVPAVHLLDPLRPLALAGEWRLAR